MGEQHPICTLFLDKLASLNRSQCLCSENMKSFSNAFELCSEIAAGKDVPVEIVYECGICDCYHPWNWNGDCRDDANRYSSPEDFAKRNNVSPHDVEVRSMGERVDAVV